MPSAHLVSALPNTALIVIDVQQVPQQEIHAELGEEHNRPPCCLPRQKLSVLHVHHINTKNKDSLFYEATRPTNVLPFDYVAPAAGELVLRKYDKSSGFGAHLISDGTTSLQDVLAAQGVRTVILVGISSAHCVSSTARSAGDRGLDVIVVADGTATHAVSAVDCAGTKGDSKDGSVWCGETVHAVSMAHLDGELADVVTTAEVLKCL
ncbi:Isochorismatase-like protein [Mycena crocata]|nr:Isochorismatase-like protein [Mycena crocata]